MRNTRIAFLLTALMGAQSGFASDFPKYFDAFTKTRYYLVVLHEDGKAEFLQREALSDGTVFIHHDKDAAWSYLTNAPKDAIPNICISTKKYRFFYFLEETRLTEIDKNTAFALSRRSVLDQSAK